MEQSWYLFPGQTLENTKIENRGKALIATPEAWQKITDHLDRRRVQQEIIDEEVAHRQMIKEVSNNMVKNWDNSIEKVRQRRFEEHEEKIRAREENLYKRFMELRQEQAEERNRIVEEAKKRMFMIKQDSRTLNSALLLTETLHERKLQEQFDEVEKEKEVIEAGKYAELVIYNAQQEKKENAEKIRKRKEKDVKHSQELMKQIKEIEADVKKTHEEKIKLEIEDGAKAKVEMKAIKEYEYMLDKNKKAIVKQQFHDFAKQQKEIKEEQRKQEECEDKIIQTYAKGKCRIEELKKKKEKEFKDQQILIREKIAKKIMAQAADKADEEERILAHAQKEYEEKELENLKKKKEYQAKLRQQRIENRKNYLERKRKEDEEKRELVKWEMINRLKSNEVVEKYELDKAQRLFDEKIKYRRELNEQVKDDDTSEYDKRCKEQELLYYKNKIENEDKTFFAYADEVLNLAKKRGRSTIPIEKVVHQYKRENNLLPLKKNLTALQSNIPINKK